MQRRALAMGSAGAVLALIGLLLAVGSGEAASAAEDRIQDLGGGHYVFQQVSNAGFIVTEEGILVVDSLASPNHARSLLKAIGGISDKPILYLVNTHWHWDHTFGNDAFPESTKIYATEACKKRMAVDGRKLWEKQAPADPANYKGAKLVLPEVTFADETTITLGDRRILLKRLGEGHTRGDAVVVDPSARVIYAGDLLFGGMHPYMADEQSNSEAWISTLKKLQDLARPDSEKWKIVPGHGEPSTPALAGFLAEYIETLRAEVKKALDAKTPVDQIPSRIQLPEKFKKLGAPGFLKRNIDRLIEELK